MLSAALGRQQNPLHEALFWDGDDGRWAIREDNWKLVYNEGEYELFDLVTDEGEVNDLSVDQPAKVRDLTTKFMAWRDEMAAPMGRKK